MVVNGAYRTYFLLAVLVAFPWMVVSLTANVVNLANSGQTSNTPVKNPIGQNIVSPVIPTLSRVGSSSAGSFLYQVGWISALVVLSGILMYVGLRKKYLSKRRMVHILIGGMIVPALFYLQYFGLRNVYGYLASLVPGPSSAQINSAGLVAAVAIGMAIGGAALGLFFSIRSRDTVPIYDRLSHMEEIEKKVEEFRNVINKATYLLDTGSDYRATIIQCYKSLCSLLEDIGVQSGVSLTPREFEDKVVSRLMIPPRYLHEVTNLFEKARYSNEEVQQEEAARARDCLSKLSYEIKQYPVIGYPLTFRSSIAGSSKPMNFSSRL